MKYYRTFRPKNEGGETRTHLEGIGDSYTLCGVDTAGDFSVHAKPPIALTGIKHRISCEHCQDIINIVLGHLYGKRLNPKARHAKQPTCRA